MKRFGDPGDSTMRENRWIAMFVLAGMGVAQSPAAGLQERIDRAVERGVQALRKSQQPGGLWDVHGAGSTSLVGLALLESGVKPDDPAIIKAAEAVREDASASDRVYRVALAIMFLDRLGDSTDIPLIQALAVRLMEGQVPAPRAGWSYGTPSPTTDETDRLRNLRAKTVKLKTEPGSPEPRHPAVTDPDLLRRLEILETFGTQAGGRNPSAIAAPDNSNTQFAVLALWIARRHGVPTDASLRRAEYYFRATHESGTWTYTPGAEPFGRAATTCSGLLGLAAGSAILRTTALKTQPEGKPARIPRHPLDEPLVQTALNFVGLQMAAVGASGIAPQVNTERDYYFLWSLERVAMIYGLTRIGTIDWYAIGSAVIVTHQLPSGIWKGRYSADIDTSFALLFLRRSNLASDMSAVLKQRQQTAMSAKNAQLDDKPVVGAAENRPVDAAEKLAQDLLRTTGDRQNRILSQLRDERGTEYTDALVSVIPQLVGDIQRKARECLAERLARMTPATLKARLRDPSVELRRAAALACAAKDDRSMIGDLIAALDDKDVNVVRAVGVALKSLTGENLGPSADASPEERGKAIAAWKSWWKKQTP